MDYATYHLLGEPETTIEFLAFDIRRENGGTLGMVPLIINPIYTLYSGYLLGISTFKGLLEGLNS